MDSTELVVYAVVDAVNIVGVLVVVDGVVVVVVVAVVADVFFVSAVIDSSNPLLMSTRFVGVEDSVVVVDATEVDF